MIYSCTDQANNSLFCIGWNCIEIIDFAGIMGVLIPFPIHVDQVAGVDHLPDFIIGISCFVKFLGGYELFFDWEGHHCHHLLDHNFTE